MLSDGKIDVSLNRLVPKHEIVPKDEEQKVLASVGVPKQQLSKMLDTDPQAKRLGAKPGQIVKIARVGNFETIPNTYYRLVVRYQKK
jgi:DNA-directed RNA polymerase subunit H